MLNFMLNNGHKIFFIKNWILTSIRKRTTYCGRRRIVSGTLIKQFWDNFKVVMLDDKSGIISRIEKEVNTIIFQNYLNYFSYRSFPKSQID